MDSLEEDFSFFGDNHSLSSTHPKEYHQVIKNDGTPSKALDRSHQKLQRKLFHKKAGKKFQPPIKAINLLSDSQDIFSQPVQRKKVETNEMADICLHSEDEGFRDLSGYISPKKKLENNEQAHLRVESNNSHEIVSETYVTHAQKHKPVYITPVKIATPPDYVDSLPVDLNENSQIKESVEVGQTGVFSEQPDRETEFMNENVSAESADQDGNFNCYKDLNSNLEERLNEKSACLPSLEDENRIAIYKDFNCKENEHFDDFPADEVIFLESHRKSEQKTGFPFHTGDQKEFCIEDINHSRSLSFPEDNTSRRVLLDSEVNTSNQSFGHNNFYEEQSEHLIPSPCFLSKQSFSIVSKNVLEENKSHFMTETTQIFDENLTDQTSITSDRFMSTENLIENNVSNGRVRSFQEVSTFSRSDIGNEQSFAEDMNRADNEINDLETAVPVSRLESFFSTPLVKKAPFAIREFKEEIFSPFVQASMNCAPEEYYVDAAENILVQWCLQANVFEDIEQQVIENNNENVFELKIEISVQDITDFNVSLGSKLMQHPADFFYLFKQMCCTYLNSRNKGGSSNNFSPEQLLLSYHISNMPYIEEHTIKSVKLHQSKYGRLLLIPCQILSMSRKYSYTKSAAYYCPFGCQHDYQDRLYVSSDVGIAESDMIRNDLTCQLCAGRLEEDVTKRLLSEKCQCFVLLRGPNVVHRKRNMTQCLKAFVKDEMADLIEIGGMYWFTCILQHESPRGNATDVQHYSNAVLDVISIEKFSRFLRHTKSYEAVLPDFLCSLYQDRISSPWSFVASLASTFLDYITPPGTYFLLKYVLLLNLIMEDEACLNKQAHTPKNFHILFVGSDVLTYQKMFIEASTYCSLESSIYQPPINLFGSASNDGDNAVISGGNLSLASSSVCIVPNLLQLKKSDIEQLSKVCESQQVDIKLPRSDKNQMSQVSYPFHGALWCCLESTKENEPAFERLTRQFHIVLKEKQIDEGQLDIQHDLIVSKMLKRKSSISDVVSKEDMKEYIKAAQQTRVSMLTQTEELLKAYYLLYRNLNPSLSSYADMELLTCLATAHAKAMFHEQITLDDAVLSIYLFEQLSYLKSQTTLLGVRTVMFFDLSEMNLYIGPQNDERMLLLKEHIISYCSARLPHMFRAR